MSCNRGIYRVHKQELNDLADGKIKAITSISYGKSDGLLSAECNGGGKVGILVGDGAGRFSQAPGSPISSPINRPLYLAIADFNTNTVNAGDATVFINFAAPTVTDNCPGVRVVCSPPSASPFPRGITTVTCTATDAANNQTTCAFTARVYDYVIVDDASTKLLRFDSLTDDYDFFDCRKATSLSGSKDTGSFKLYTLIGLNVGTPVVLTIFIYLTIVR